MARSAVLVLVFASAWLGLACQSPPGAASIAAHTLRERHREIRPGQGWEEVRARMGELPVRRPGHPDDPFPTPYRAIRWRTRDGDEVRLEVYVVAVRPADGCPDVQYEDAPVAYRNGRVVAVSWDDLEWRWREWGGDLAVLRAIQDRFVCPGDPPPEPPLPGGVLDSPPASSYIPAPSGGARACLAS